MKNNIRVERARLNVSQAKLAEMVGVTRQTINAIELGKYAPSAILALKLASVFSTSVDQLFTLEESDWL